MDTLHPIQIEIFRTMSFQEKYRIAQGMHLLARETRLRVARREHPEWSENQCQAAVAHEFLHRKP